MAAIPLLSALGTRLAGRRPAPVATDLLPPGPAEGAGAARVIIAGFGRVGRTVAALLDAHGMAYVALDNDAERVAA